MIPAIIDADAVNALRAAVALTTARHAGTRRLLDEPWCRGVAAKLSSHEALRELLPATLVPVQCTYFVKSERQNWLVTLHQDLSVPVERQIEHPACSAGSRKEGLIFTQPPLDVLEALVAIRVHLDANEADNGPLRIVPGSHRCGRLNAEQAAVLREDRGERACLVPLGGVLAMKPLLLHASSKAQTYRPRRVLHVVFGPRDLAHGLEWPVHRSAA